MFPRKGSGHHHVERASCHRQSRPQRGRCHRQVHHPKEFRAHQIQLVLHSYRQPNTHQSGVK